MDVLTDSSLANALGLGPSELVAFVGAGGKTTASLLLAEDLVAAGRRVVVTTTTAMFLAQLAAAGPVFRGGSPGGLAGLEAALARGGRAGVAGADGTNGKVAGLPAAEVDALWASGVADCLVVEADGSRRSPFKAFGPHEPQVPHAATTIVDVAGLDVLGAPLTEEHVHRAALLAASLGIPLGSQVTARVLADGLREQVARLRQCCPGARLVVVLNKAESPEAQEAGRAVTRELLQGGPSGDDLARRPDRVVVASLHERRFAVEEAA